MEIFDPYRRPGTQGHPRSFSRTCPPSRTYFYGTIVSEVPSKPRTSAHMMFSTGAIRPIESTFRVLRRQSPLTAKNRRTSFMSPPNARHQRTVLLATKRAPVGWYAFLISWGCSDLSGGWCGGCHSLAHTLSQGIALPPHTAVVNSIKTNLGDREAKAKWVRESVMRDSEESACYACGG